jgi:tight adherence protein B
MNGYIVPLIYVLAFVAVVILVQTVAGAFFSAGDKTRRVNRRLSLLESGMDPQRVFDTLVRKSAAPSDGKGLLTRAMERIETLQRQGGLDISPQHLISIAGGVAALLWLGSLALLSAGRGGNFVLNAAVSLIAAVGVSGFGAWFWISSKRSARLRKIEEQLPLALDVVTRAIRAGHPVVAAVQLAANELGDPVGSEFGLIVDETTYGAEFKEALASFARRTGSSDAHFFAVSVSIQSETGGNLAEILEGLASVIRGRNTLGKRVKALASEGKASAYLLSVLPPGMVILQMLVNPSFYTSKFSDPIFWPVSGVVLVVYLIGWAMIYRIMNFKY